MRIAYITTYDSTNVRNWSGSGSFIAKCLEQQSIEVRRIGPLNLYTDPVMAARTFYYTHITKKTYHIEREPRVLKSYAKQIESKLRGLKVDAIFSPGTIPISFLKSKVPIVFWTDATYAAMVNYYPHWSNVCRKSIVDGNRMEQTALSNCRLAIYTSDWAANTAQKYYRVDPSKIRVVPFGPNIDVNVGFNEVKTIVQQRRSDVCKLLLVGVDWYRKGADIAVKLAETLNSRGIRTQLTIQGCTAPQPVPDFVSVKRFVSKRTEAGQKQLRKALEDSHFLVLPTRADCVPVVIAEANTHGVPVLATNVGGIPTAIANGVNGLTFPLTTFVEDAAEVVGRYMRNFDRYQQLAMSSFCHYERYLNWTNAGKKVKEYLHEVCR
jgi:glycosyltransferase involved in cell wall biosynthesis